MSMRFALSFVGLLLTISPGFAGTPLAERLRQSVRAPSWNEYFIIMWDGDGLVFDREMPDLEKRRFDSCLSELDGTDNDIEVLHELSGLAASRSNETQQLAYARMELGLLRKALEREPDNLDHLIGIGELLGLLKHFDESERYFEKVHQLAPREPRLWATWGHAKLQQAMSMVSTELKVGMCANLGQLTHELRKANLDEVKRIRILELIAKGRDYCDLAVLLSPNRHESYRSRIMFNGHRIVFEMALQYSDTPPDSAYAHPAMRQIGDDFAKWAVLQPEKPRLLASAFCMEFEAAVCERCDSLPKWENISDDARRSLNRKLDCLRTMSSDLDLNRSFEANLMLAMLHTASLDQPNLGLPYARKAFALRPDHPVTGILYCSALSKLGRWDGVALISEQALKHCDNIALRSFRVEALHQTRSDAALKTELAHLLRCATHRPEESLLLAAGWLRSTEPNASEEARKHLVIVSTRENQFMLDQKQDAQLLAVHIAVLDGRLDEMAAYLQSAQGENEPTERAHTMYRLLVEHGAKPLVPTVEPMDFSR